MNNAALIEAFTEVYTLNELKDLRRKLVLNLVSRSKEDVAITAVRRGDRSTEGQVLSTFEEKSYMLEITRAAIRVLETGSSAGRSPLYKDFSQSYVDP